MGSLIVGAECAKTIAYVCNKPLIAVNHIAGHIYANNLNKKMEYPLIALVVSGGHTELIYMEEEYKFEKLGGTLDDAVGESYDKVARVIGVGYPGGPVIDKMAHEGVHEYNLPVPLNNDSYNFSFSGLKSAVINLAHNNEQRGIELNKNNLAKSFQDVVVETITKKTLKALNDKKVKRMVIAGGVAANTTLRETLKSRCEEEGIECSYPPMKYCTDNAAMIGAAAYYAYKKGIIADSNLNANSSVKLV
jgi:N6-L-threonylcarbamoyladenine synthase